MTVYLGDKAVGANTIVEKEVAKTKYGIDVEDILGVVNENGTLFVNDTDLIEPFDVDLTGVKGVYGSVFYGKFEGNAGIRNFIANDVTTVYGSLAFYQAFKNSSVKVVEMNGLTTMPRNAGVSAFYQAFNRIASYYEPPTVTFNSLKSCWSSSAFREAFNGVINPDSVWPVLEEVGNGSFYKFCAQSNGDTFTFSSIKTIEGGTNSFSATFYTNYSVSFKFPRCTQCTNTVLNNKGSLHFAVANQAAIEACAGYENKFGAVEIYFDLILTITANGNEYSRSKTEKGYISWLDAFDNIVYTDATAEPAVGTVVYSDAGTTQVGTVEGVA